MSKKKQFLVTKTSTDHNVTGVEVDGQKMEFSKSGYSFYLSDEGKARELNRTLGKGSDNPQVVVSEVPMANKDGIHNYTFSIKKPKLEEDDTESKWVWVDDGKGKQKMVRKDASIRTA